MVNYTNDELLQNPLIIIRSIIRMHAMLSDGMTALIDQIDQDGGENADSNRDSRLLEFDNKSDENEENAVQKHNLLQESNRYLNRSIRAKDSVLFADSEIKMTDPSKFYELKHEDKLGEGGFAKVFKASRRTDGLICALKFCEPKNESDRNLVINEIGLMN